MSNSTLKKGTVPHDCQLIKEFAERIHGCHAHGYGISFEDAWDMHAPELFQKLNGNDGNVFKISYGDDEKELESVYVKGESFSDVSSVMYEGFEEVRIVQIKKLVLKEK